MKVVQRGTKRQPATGKAPVEHEPRTSKEAKSDPGDQQVDIEGDTKDVVVETNIVIIADTLMQVLKNQVPREAEIHDLEKVMKSQPLAKESSEPHLIQALPLPISVERHASALKPNEFQ